MNESRVNVRVRFCVFVRMCVLNGGWVDGLWGWNE